MKLIITAVLIILLFLFQNSVKAQQVNTLYFLEKVPVRHFLNPAFIPKYDVYISPTTIGLTQFDVGNNSIMYHDLLYQNESKTGTKTFKDDLAKFYKVINPTLRVNLDYQTNFLGFGFRNKSGYITFSMTDKINSFLNVPKELFNMAFFGTNATHNYDLSDMKFDVTKYTEIAIGYSRNINQRLALGAKLKINLGTANISNINNNFTLESQPGNLLINATGTLNSANYIPTSGLDSISVFKQNFKDFMMPYGMGLGFDLGVDYQLSNRLVISAALLDVGFINWSKTPQNINYSSVNHTDNNIGVYVVESEANIYEDISNFTSGTTIDETIVNTFESAVMKSTNLSYNTYTRAKVNIGAEYSLIYKYLSLGLLSYSEIFMNTIDRKLTISAITKPREYFNAALSYTLLNGMATVGAGFAFQTGYFHWFAAADYIPLYTYPLNTENFDSKIAILPYRSKSLNVSVGMNLVFERIFNDRNYIARKAVDFSGLKGAYKKIDISMRNGPKIKGPLYKKSKKGLHSGKDNDCHCN